jgi:hypothetical protein
MYLDPQGLAALWRKALLAREVLRGRAVGYRRQLTVRNPEADPLFRIVTGPMAEWENVQWRPAISLPASEERLQ